MSRKAAMNDRDDEFRVQFRRRHFYRNVETEREFSFFLKNGKKKNSTMTMIYRAIFVYVL